MRHIFCEQLIKRARKNKNVYLLTGDLGYNCFEQFIKEFPDRFINVGVAENNMLGIGTGLALSGKEVYIYSIIPFLIYKTLEHLRNYISAYDLNIKLIGAGGGFSYGIHGISHNPFEDIAILKSLPNLKILTPGSKIETILALEKMFKNKGVFYIRLGKVLDYEIHKKIQKYKLGDGLIIKKGKDLTLIGSGNIIGNVMKVAKKLEKKGFSVCIINYICLKPINKKFILQKINKKSKIFCIEEHIKSGGLGSIISEILLENNYSNLFFKKIGLLDKSHIAIGDQEFLREINNLGVNSLEKTILKHLNNKNSY